MLKACKIKGRKILRFRKREKKSGPPSKQNYVLPKETAQMKFSFLKHDWMKEGKLISPLSFFSFVSNHPRNKRMWSFLFWPIMPQKCLSAFSSHRRLSRSAGNPASLLEAWQKIYSLLRRGANPCSEIQMQPGQRRSIGAPYSMNLFLPPYSLVPKLIFCFRCSRDVSMPRSWLEAGTPRFLPRATSLARALNCSDVSPFTRMTLSRRRDARSEFSVSKKRETMENTRTRRQTWKRKQEDQQ